MLFMSMAHVYIDTSTNIYRFSRLIFYDVVVKMCRTFFF